MPQCIDIDAPCSSIERAYHECVPKFWQKRGSNPRHEGGSEEENEQHRDNIYLGDSWFASMDTAVLGVTESMPSEIAINVDGTPTVSTLTREDIHVCHCIRLNVSTSAETYNDKKQEKKS